jgi:hypothetical protein
MAFIENRSQIQVTVRNRNDLSKTFAHNADKAIQRYVLELRSQGLKPRLASLDNYYLVRTRSVAHKNQVLIAHSEAEAYKINALLENAGLPRQDMAAIRAAPPNPHPKVAGMKVRKPTGTRVGEPSETSKFIRKAFAAIVPDDFMDYIDQRCQVVEPGTVDREIDLFSAVCHLAIDTWRIHVA